MENKFCSICGFSYIKIDYSDYPAEKMKFMCFQKNIALAKLFKKHKLHLSRFFSCNYTKSCYCVNMVSVTSVSCNIKVSVKLYKPVSHYHPR